MTGPWGPESKIRMRILAISGSLRAGSHTGALLRGAVALAPRGARVTVYEGVGGLPHFSPERDGDNPPESVAELRSLLRQADAVMIFTPEYAHGMPGSLKNALDWTVSSGEFDGKPVAAISASPSAMGGDNAHAWLVQTLSVLGARIPADAALIVPFVRKVVDENGMILDAATADAFRAAFATLGATDADGDGSDRITPDIRAATGDDAALVAELGRRTFDEAFRDNVAPDDMAAYLADAFAEEKIRSELNDRETVYLLAFVNDAPVGYARLHFGEPHPSVSGPNAVKLWRLYTDAAFQGHGIGAALVRAAGDAARLRGGKSLWLTTNIHNARAISFYERAGFAVVGGATFTLGSVVHTDHVMVCRL